MPKRSSRLLLMRSVARWRHGLAPALLGAPLACVWAFDWANRPGSFGSFSFAELGAYVAASAESALLWSPVVVLAARRRGLLRHVAAVVLVLLATAVFGAQRYFFGQYATYLNVDAARFGAAVTGNVLNQVLADSRHFVAQLAPVLIASALLVAVLRLLMRPTRRVQRAARWLVVPALVMTLVLPCSYRRAQAATPDVLFLHAIGRLAASHLGLSSQQWTAPAERKPDYVPPMVSAPSPRRNVVLIVAESLRADSVCSAPTASCPFTPYSNAAAPDRLGLTRLRSVASTTSVSVAVLWSGLSPTEPLEATLSSPLLWDYAHAAGWHGAYFTSQNLTFANTHKYVKDLPVERRCAAHDLVAGPDIDLGAPDELLMRRAVQELASMQEPFFAVVQTANTHFPYRTDPDRAPFQPSTSSKDPARNHEFFNRYRNAVHLHDAAVGEFITGVRALPSGPRTVIIFTSDHGEAFREHHQLGHTGSVFDEEVHVPGWIDAPASTLTEKERASLRRASDAFVSHLDIAPTVLDLLGLWDSPQLARFRARMPGTSLLRGAQVRAVPLTNCTAIWPCPFRNWGMMRGQFKLEARAWDSTWHCYDLLADPMEKKDLGTAACGDLAAQAVRTFGKHPRED